MFIMISIVLNMWWLPAVLSVPDTSFSDCEWQQFSERNHESYWKSNLRAAFQHSLKTEAVCKASFATGY